MGSIIFWIDSDLGDGNSCEEWKGEVEINKIFGLKKGIILVNGLCICVGVIRCYSVVIIMKFKCEVDEVEFVKRVSDVYFWVKYVFNNKEVSVSQFIFVYISGMFKVGVGCYK